MKPQHVVIDGYNLLGAMTPGVLAWDEAKRETLIVRLGLYGQRIGCPVTVVFDAWSRTGQSRQVSHRAGVTVQYSQGGEKADQVIQEWVRSRTGECVVVSSDSEVLAVAKAHGAFTIRSETFAARLKEKSTVGRSPSGARKGRGDDDENPSPSKSKKGNPRKLPKKVRERNRIMRKF